MKFNLGQVVITANAQQTLNPDDVLAALNRHVVGDWGNLDPEDQQVNETALLNGGRLLSAYWDRAGVKFWIISEADRSSTCILRPEDY